MSTFTPPWTPTKLLKQTFASEDDLDLIWGCEHEYFQEWFLELGLSGKYNVNDVEYPYLGLSQCRPGDGTLNMLFEDEASALQCAEVTKRVCDDFGISYSTEITDFVYDPSVPLYSVMTAAGF
jgi:hypothetical protein